MKTAIVGLCFLCLAGAALAQASAGAGAGLNSEPVIYEFNSHVGHAAPQSMGHEQNLLIGSGSNQGHGTRPLWEVHKPAQKVPLGDTARMLRKEHVSAPKSSIVWHD